MRSCAYHKPLMPARRARGGESKPLRPAMLKPFMPETTRASGVFTGKADVSWDTTKEGAATGAGHPERT